MIRPIPTSVHVGRIGGRVARSVRPLSVPDATRGPMKVGDTYTHPAKPEWGAGVVTEVRVDGYVVVAFEHREAVTLQTSTAESVLKEADIDPSSELRDAKKWRDLSLPPEQRRQARAAATCRACGERLNESQWSTSRTWKSCPKCSARDGSQHIFYEYPDAFGTTEHRVSEASPDGAQSYCEACRTKGEHARPLPCADAVDR
jgi:hypothetical protein